MKREDIVAAGLVVAGTLWAAASLLDPMRPSGAFLGPGLAACGLVLRWRAGLPLGRWALPAALAAAFSVAAAVGPVFAADAPLYYMYMRSVLFDGDLDFANEARVLLRQATLLPTPTGHLANVHAVGPSVVWSPFLVLAHLYVKVSPWIGGTVYRPDGFSTPYLRSTAVGTVTVAVLGMWLLLRALRERVDARCATLAALATFAASPMLYYVFVNPAMSHGLAFGLAAACLWAVDRVDRAPSLRGWIVVGLLLGLVTLVRAQAIVLALLPAAVGAAHLVRGRSRPAWLLAGAVAAVVAFAPQMATWKIVFDELLWYPRGYGLGRGHPIVWSSPRLLDILLSADRGLFSWTPAMALGVLGLVPAARRWGSLAIGGLLVFAAATWFNGSLVGDWAGSDSFGSRRFDAVVPILALGAAALIEWLLRRPVVVVALGLGVLVLWNIGLVRLYATREIDRAAPLEDVAGRQARQLRHAADTGLGRLLGQRGRELSYKLFVGEYFYENTNFSGTISPAAADGERYLGRGWSRSFNQDGPPTFRFALYPKACVHFGLLESPGLQLPTVIRARAPKALENQVMSVFLNGSLLRRAPLGAEWTDVPVTLSDALVSGENSLCLEFTLGLPGEGRDQIAAAVSLIQLP